MAGPFDFLHVKGKKAGSPNELSFDVLDAARSEANAKKKSKGLRAGPAISTPEVVKPTSKSSSKQAGTQAKSATKTKAPKQKAATGHGVGKTATFSGEPEVERRKRARRNHSLRVGFLVAVALIALAGTAGYFGFKFYQERVDFNGHYRTIIDRFVETDRTLVEVDSLMKDPLNPADSAARDKAMDSIPGISRNLNDMLAELKSMENDARGDDDTAALSSALTATQARKNMVTSAEEAFTLSKRAGEQIASVEAAWNKALKGDELARAATTKANAAATEPEITAAKKQTEEARTQFVEAKADLQKAMGESGATFEAEIAYLDKRIESLDQALKTADSLIAMRRDEAKAHNDAYNAADAEAVTLAANLTTSPATKVTQAYEAAIVRAEKVYGDARQQAITADSAIRGYL